MREVAERDRVSYWLVREYARDVGGRTGPARISVGVEDAVAAYAETGSATRAAELLTRKITPISLSAVRARLWEAGVFDHDPKAKGRTSPRLLDDRHIVDIRDQAAAVMAERRTENAVRVLNAWDSHADVDAVCDELPDLTRDYVRGILRMNDRIATQPYRVPVTNAQARAAVKRYGSIYAAARALGVSRNAIAARVE